MAALLLVLTPTAAMAASADFTSGVASGDVTSSKAILWTRAVPTSSNAKLKAEVWPESSCLVGQKAYQKSNIQPLATRDYTIKVDATGLQPGTEYCFRYRRGEEAFSDVGHFKTAPDENTAADVSMTYDGDSDGVKPGGTPAYNNFEALGQAQSENADFFAYIGDTIYSDSEVAGQPPATTLAEYRDKYKENRTYSNLTNLLASTSTYALMDDHEIVNDYDGQTVDPARYATGRQAFLEYMPVRESGLLQDSSCADDPLYRTYKWGADVEVFVLDTRSCRSADVASSCLSFGSPDLGPTLPGFIRTAPGFNLFLTPTAPPGCLSAIFDSSRTVLGPVQKTKFKNDLVSSTAKFKYVLNEYAIQQFYALPYDRWEGYGAERNELLNFIRGNDIDNVAFLTTDHHATMQNQVWIDRFLDQQTIAHEFVTGPIATNTLQVEVTNLVGPLGVNIFLALLGPSIAQLDCKNLNQYSYGKVSYDSSTSSTTVDSKDDAGVLVKDQSGPATVNPSVPCTKTLP